MAAMLEFAQLCESVAATTKKTAKRQFLEQYFRNQAADDAAVAAVFLSGRPFAAYDERTLQVGGNFLWRVLLGLSGVSEAELGVDYRRHGDLGSAAQDVLTGSGKDALAGKASGAAPSVALHEVQHAFFAVASARGPAAKQRLIHDLLACCSALEVKYIVKIMTGDLRIGLRESLVEEAIAQAFAAPIEEVRRANMLLGDIAETLRLAQAQNLGATKMRLFHPIGFMLANPADTVADAFSAFAEPHVEDKYDGIRAQVHCGDPNQPGRVRIFSRTLDDVTASFPELEPFFAVAPFPLVLDGEIVAWELENPPPGRARPFSELQKRLGRKQVRPELIRAVPVTYVCFDVLYARGELIIDLPLRERRRMLDEIAAALLQSAAKAPFAGHQPGQASLFQTPVEEPSPAVPALVRAPVATANSAHEMEQLFDLARERGNEGLMIKNPTSAYTPGRRGNAWLKLKKELATLDVVITAAEYGHGRRAQWLSDYTFAVRDGERLRNVGKAYSGVTDEEIAELTAWCKAHTLVDYGHSRTVSPEIVLEVAFNNVMISDRHDSGFALRFPRIVRIRWDKGVGEIDTLERVREIYEKQRAA